MAEGERDRSAVEGRGLLLRCFLPPMRLKLCCLLPSLLPAELPLLVDRAVVPVGNAPIERNARAEPRRGKANRNARENNVVVVLVGKSKSNVVILALMSQGPCCRESLVLC